MAIDHIEGPLPSSAPLERDARLVSTDHKVEPGEIAIGVIIGRAAEYFDFFVFAIASVVVFPKAFFPFAEPVTATLYSSPSSRSPSWRARSAPSCSWPSTGATGAGSN